MTALDLFEIPLASIPSKSFFDFQSVVDEYWMSTQTTIEFYGACSHRDEPKHHKITLSQIRAITDSYRLGKHTLRLVIGTPDCSSPDGRTHLCFHEGMDPADFIKKAKQFRDRYGLHKVPIFSCYPDYTGLRNSL